MGPTVVTRASSNYISVCLLGLLAGTAYADGTEPVVATSGYAGSSGLIVIPTARILPEGTAELAANSFWDRRYTPRTVSGYGTGFAIGLLPGLEVSGRIANYETSQKWFLRDLSANAKWQLPSLIPGQPDLAVGVTDFGGAASNFRSTYGVASKAFGPVDLTLGYGRGPDQFNGWFGGVQLATPVQGLSALAEHESRDKYLGLRYVSPPWEGLGQARLIGTLSRSLGAKDASGKAADRTEAGLSLQIPLGQGSSGRGAAPSSTGVHRATNAGAGPSVIHWQSADGAMTAMALPKVSDPRIDPLKPRQVKSSEADQLNSTSGPTAARVQAPSSESADQADQKAALQAARAQLMASGFDHVQVGTVPAGRQSSSTALPTRHWVARLEPALYARNDADAVGVALGILAKTSAVMQVDELVLVLERAGRGMYQVRVKRDDWLKYLDANESEGARASLEVTPWPGLGSSEDDVHWLNAPVERQDKVRLSVGLRYAAYYATEVGIYDYSVAPAVTAHVPLWRGAELSATGVLPPFESRNFQPGYVFSGTGIRSGVSQAALNQSWWLGSRVLNVSSVGRYFYDQWGVQHESVAFLPWNEDSLRFRFTKTRRAADVKPSAAAAEMESAQMTYRWQLPSLQGYTELHWNRYISGDAGPSVDFRRFFGDFQFGLTLRSSARDKFAGLTVELPLMPGRGWRSGAGFSVTSERVAQTGVLSRVGNTHNSVAADAAVLTPYDYNVTNLMLNRNRWQRAYFLQELPRLKAAYEAEVSKLR
jgi:Exopolysaccharide biosynthesis protein YbjH